MPRRREPATAGPRSRITADGTGQEQEALAGKVGADLLALEVAQVAAGQPDGHDQVVAVALAGQDQGGQLPRHRKYRGAV